jgi:hypothetical protein
MRISRIGATRLASVARRSTDRRLGETFASRALVAIEPAVAPARPRSPTRYPAAPFLAQLIATHLQAPQTRARRRAEPDEAIAAYRSVLKKPA